LLPPCRAATTLWARSKVAGICAVAISCAIAKLVNWLGLSDVELHRAAFCGVASCLAQLS
jgi:hypothetical protein